MANSIPQGQKRAASQFYHNVNQSNVDQSGQVNNITLPSGSFQTYTNVNQSNVDQRGQVNNIRFGNSKITTSGDCSGVNICPDVRNISFGNGSSVKVIKKGNTVDNRGSGATVQETTYNVGKGAVLGVKETGETNITNTADNFKYQDSTFNAYLDGLTSGKPNALSPLSPLQAKNSSPGPSDTRIQPVGTPITFGRTLVSNGGLKGFVQGERYVITAPESMKTSGSIPHTTLDPSKLLTYMSICSAPAFDNEYDNVKQRYWIWNRAIENPQGEKPAQSSAKIDNQNQPLTVNSSPGITPTPDYDPNEEIVARWGEKEVIVKGDKYKRTKPESTDYINMSSFTGNVQVDRKPDGSYDLILENGEKRQNYNRPAIKVNGVPRLLWEKVSPGVEVQCGDRKAIINGYQYEIIEPVELRRTRDMPRFYEGDNVIIEGQNLVVNGKRYNDYGKLHPAIRVKDEVRFLWNKGV